MAGILFLPLKGAVLRVLYPEPWMRTSCDMDILIYLEDMERTAVLLEERRGFTRGKLHSHDISLYAPNQIHLELHYDLIDEPLARHMQVISCGAACR